LISQEVPSLVGAQLIQQLAQIRFLVTVKNGS
jgi:hypothetical protein